METKYGKALVLCCISIAIALVVSSVFAADVIVYPAKGQSETKMNKDKADCQAWAVKQTGVDPNVQAPAPQTESQSSAPKGGRLRGGARDAAGGAAVGAIAGDAGKGAAIGAAAGGMRGGMEQRKEKREEKAGKQQAQAQQQQQRLDSYNRAYSACLEGRGYSVK